MQELTIGIDGMSCGHCVMAVRKALDALGGVQVKDVKVGQAVVSFDPARSSADAVRAAIAGAGYQPRAA